MPHIMTDEEIYKMIDAGEAERKNYEECVKKGKLPDAKGKQSYISGSEYDGNTIPDSLLEDGFKESDKHGFYVKTLKLLKLVLASEYNVKGKLASIFEKALSSKYGKEYAALNQALPLMKKSFNVATCDVAIAASEIILHDEFKLKWVDVNNKNIIKEEMMERFSLPKEGGQNA
jgi:hypothetical protein